MSNSTRAECVKPQRPRHDPEAVRRALAVLGPKWERLERLPHLHKIMEVACGARMARDSLIELMNISAHIEGVMDPEAGGEGMTWEDLDYEMAGWLWSLNHLVEFLHTNFTADVEEAWFHAGALKGEEEAAYRACTEPEVLARIDAAQAAEPPDTPTVAQLPSLRGRPYWQAEGGQP